MGICPGRQESEVVKKEFDNLTFLWKPDWYDVEIRFLSLFNGLFLWRNRQGQAAGIGVSLQKWAQPRKESLRSRAAANGIHQPNSRVESWPLDSLFPTFCFTCETSLQWTPMVCARSRATSPARGVLRIRMAVWCLPFSSWTLVSLHRYCLIP